MKATTIMLVTGIIWLVVALGLFYHRAFYAWHWGTISKFFVLEFPILTVILIIILMLESYYFREKE